MAVERQDDRLVAAAVLDTSLDGVITIDREGQVLEWNAAAERMFGYGRVEAIGRRLDELIIPESMRPAHREGLARYLATGEAPILGKRLELTAVRADGEEFPIELAIVRVPTDEVLFTGYARDITERKRTEDALRRSEERFRGIVNHSIAGVAEVDLTGRFLFANQRYCRIVGREAGELLTMRMQDITHPDDLQKNLVQFDKIVRDGVPFIIEKRYVRADGAAVWVNASVSGLRGHDGTVNSIVAVCVDVTDRRRADEARQAGEERLRTLIDNLPHGAVYRAVRAPGDAASRFTYLSAGVEQLLGITAEEGVADSSKVYAAINPEDIDRVQAEERRASERMEQFNSEFRIHTPSGALRWLHCRSAPNRLSDGSVAWEGVMLDVTDRKTAEQTLRENEERLRLALEAGGMRAWDWDVRSDAIRWSPKSDASAGEVEPPMSFEAFQQAIHPHDRDRVVDAVRQTLRAGSEHRVEFRLSAPGGVRWIESRGTLVRSLAGTPIHMTGVDLDVTRRKIHEEDLKFLAEASRSLATLVDYESTMQRIASLRVPHFADWFQVHVADEPGVLRQLAVAHVDPDKVALAEELNSRWPPDPDAPGGIYEVFRTGQSLLVEDLPEGLLRESIRDRDQLQSLLALGLKSYICVPLAARGHTVGVLTFACAESGRRYTAAELSIAEDLGRRAAIASENARLYAAVREEARRKDEFLAMLAHELRNPLAPIRSGLDLLKLMGVDAEVLGTLQQQVEHLVRLVDDLLDVSRIMRGKVELRREHVELSAVVARAVDTVRPMIEKHKQTLAVELDPTPAWLMADPVRIAQVIGNLLNNASKYTEAGGHIALSTQADPEAVTVRVRDNGIGITPQLLPHVFDLFTQDQRSIDRSQGGLGIGLTVVKNMVEMHGGGVAVRSDGAGKGSEFSVRLPRVAAPQRIADTLSLAGESGPLHILVVDDNVAAAKMLSKLLAMLGPHEVYTAYDGPSAIHEAVRSGPDLVMLDIGLPGLDGFEVARRMRKLPELGGVRLVAVTGYGTDEDRRKSLAAGFDEHLVKPPSIDAVRQILGRVRR